MPNTATAIVESSRSAVSRALTKRDRIISREGDADGERLADWYLEMLIQEEIEQDAAIRRSTGDCGAGQEESQGCS